MTGGRQTPTQAGWLDLLAFDKDGRLVVYELKRGQLIQDAVTQVLAYASDLDAMSTSQLAAHIADRSQPLRHRVQHCPALLPDRHVDRNKEPTGAGLDEFGRSSVPQRLERVAQGGRRVLPPIDGLTNRRLAGQSGTPTRRALAHQPQSVGAP
ncbi:MAG: hypothetical protein OXQ94_18060 [Gemmatimonadota bacterium]|nr:hypothetical protein [Gemmatimonadota bacterium]MDE2873580.1 hypothetical protein [Gemmatimonadota bacterium]